MTHSSNVSEDGVNGLLDHAAAQAAAVAELEMMIWYGTDIILEADAIFRRYGLQHVPSDEARALLDAVKDFLLRVPPIDVDAHNWPLPERPTQTPEAADSGELPAASGPHVDVHVADDIAGIVADLAGDGDGEAA